MTFGSHPFLTLYWLKEDNQEGLQRTTDACPLTQVDCCCKVSWHCTLRQRPSERKERNRIPGNNLEINYSNYVRTNWLLKRICIILFYPALPPKSSGGHTVTSPFYLHNNPLKANWTGTVWVASVMAQRGLNSIHSNILTTTLILGINDREWGNSWGAKHTVLQYTCIYSNVRWNPPP